MPKFDVIFVLPYLFSDHPSFPEGILKRALEAHGFSVGIIETPSWQEPAAFSVLGAPRLFFAIIPGPVDSVVLNYTSTRKRRQEDLYQKNGGAFFSGCPPSIKFKIRPDRTVVVFANRIRQMFKDIPLVIGGVEATLRRFAHYDFQEDKIKRSILFDSRADLLATGMGEKQIVAIAQKANAGIPLKELDIPGTARIARDIGRFGAYEVLPTMAEILKEPAKLVEAALKIESARVWGNGALQPQDGRFVVEHPPQDYTTQDLDGIYGRPYSRSHPNSKTLSPALLMNLFSVTSHRGCGGGCAFCSISLHEGKRIISRSPGSILNEIERFNQHPRWNGIVSDIGGATAELYGSDCTNTQCKRASCLSEETCKTVRSTDKYLQLLRQCRQVKGVRKILLGSGTRYDLLLQNPELLEEILVFHPGKFLRVAPEHTEKEVLDLMRKPAFEVFEEFVELFNRIDGQLKRKVELAPYLIVGHPGETMKDVLRMAERLKKIKVKTTDVQVFTPTPGTLSTAMYYAGVSPEFKEIPVERNIKELQKRKQVLTGKTLFA
ncbi:MAG: YgiQ family radical SAM protein [Candidatus Aminicenantes bacterium]|nr:YgiQ family radical SAM protein [Candidatus Aminicenantes bacterium]